MTSSVPVGVAIKPILFVDASLQGVQMALINPQAASGAAQVLWQGAYGENKGALEQVSRLMTEGLKAIGLTAGDLAGLAVGVGPGSFTGIKVALAFVYGLRSGLNPSLPLLGVSSLEAAARALAQAVGGEVLVALPATKTHGFVARSDQLGHEPARLIDVEAEAPLGRRLVERRLYVAGSWPLLVTAAATAGESTLALTIAELAAAALPELVRSIAAAWPQQFSQDLPAPRYLRLSTAEERLIAQQAAPSAQKDLS